MPDSSADNYQIAEQYVAEPAQDYYTWLKGQGVNRIEYDTGPWSRLFNWLSGAEKKNRAKYEAYLTNLENENLTKATQSARAYDTYMSNTEVQRLMKDYEKAGLNPYLLINNGSVGSASVPTSARSDYQKHKSNEKVTDGKTLAMLLLALAKVIAK